MSLLGVNLFSFPPSCISWVCFQTANLADANASEEDKIKAMISQSIHDYDPIQSVYTRIHTLYYEPVHHVWNMALVKIGNTLTHFNVLFSRSYSKKAIGPPPGHYICFRCGKAGHYIRQCPLQMVNMAQDRKCWMNGCFLPLTVKA